MFLFALSPHLYMYAHKSSVIIISGSPEGEVENSSLGATTGLPVWFCTEGICGGIERTQITNITKNIPINAKT